MICTKLQLSTKNIECSIDTQDKYCLISGQSGSGKSLFIQELEDSINMESSFLVCDYPIIVINTVTKLDILNLSGGTYVLVADEALAHKVLLKVKDTGNYAVCITRKKYKDIDCTDGCLYVAERDSISGKTFIHPKI